MISKYSTRQRSVISLVLSGRNERPNNDRLMAEMLLLFQVLGKKFGDNLFMDDRAAIVTVTIVRVKLLIG